MDKIKEIFTIFVTIIIDISILKRFTHILFTIILCSTFVQATHIVGGEFEIKEKRGGLYDIYLNLYFDEIFGNPLAIDDPITVAIFDKATNTKQETIEMTLLTSEIVNYENPDCAIDELKIRLLRYKTPVGFQFENADYNDPQGYYIVYDRCCRNNIIDNIVDPQDVGMLFYLHFPPIFQPDGSLTGYSSPVFNIIQTRYACLEEYFFMDFGATDADGDSLVYSMSDPLIGFSSSNNPVVGALQYQSEPYPIVNWKPGYNKDDAIHGTPPLMINSVTGKLEIYATLSGLYVFSVNCEEFRNGVKIGEVRRDFQILVAPCDPNDPPSVLMENQNSDGFYQEGDTIFIANDGKRCFEFFVTDDKDPRNNERISFKVEPINFESDDDFNLAGRTGIVGGLGDTLRGIQMCWPTCEYLLNEPYLLNVIVADDGCILPKLDTIRLIIAVEPEQNTPPNLGWTHNGSSDTTTLNIEVYVNQLTEILFTGTDEDLNDTLFLSATPFSTITNSNMQFNSVTATGGSVLAPFSWNVDCELFQQLEKNISVYFYIEDNSCYPIIYRDSVLVNFELKEQEREIEQFLPANIFTPNNDGVNDIFRMPTLPKDACEDEFISFQVFNRWGRKVFGNDDRSFEWDGADVPDGVYYYLVEFEKTIYKGYVSVLR